MPCWGSPPSTRSRAGSTRSRRAPTRSGPRTTSSGPTNRLKDASVVPVAVRGVDGDKVTQTVQLAREAGATAPGIVWLEDSWGLGDADDVARLAAIVGTTTTTRAGVREAAARALANR